MNYLDEYFKTKDITYLHSWVSENYTMFYDIVDKTVRRNNMYDYSRDDLFQEAVVIFYSLVDKYNPELGKFTTFIYTALGNSLTTILRQTIDRDVATRLGAVSIDTTVSFEDGDVSLESVTENPRDEDPMTKVLIVNLGEYVDKHCNPMMQSIYKLYCNGYKLNEIADQLHVSTQHVSKSLQNLTEQVRKEWRVNEQN